METKEAEQLNLWRKPEGTEGAALGNTTELCRPPLCGGANDSVVLPQTPVKTGLDGILKKKAVRMVETGKRDNYLLREIIKWRVVYPIEKNSQQYAKYQRSTSKRSKISFDRDLYCGHVIGSHVDIKQTSESASIVYANTASCGAPWVCPVCAAKIHARRTDEVQQFIDFIVTQNAAIDGGKVPAISHKKKVLMLTLTARHNKSMPLQEFGNAISSALRKLQNSNIFKRYVRDAGLYLDDDCKIKGYIRACEYTHSYKNRWHKHFHILLTVNDDADCKLLELILKALWLDYCRKVGLCDDDENAKNSTYAHGLALSDFNMRDAENVARYVTKCGGGNYAVAEITSAATKKGRFVAGEVDRDMEHRTPNQIALDMVLYDDDKEAVSRDRDALAEYLYHTHGTAQLYWAKDLKKFVGIVDKTDEDLLAEENEGAAVVCGLTVKHWHEVCKRIDYSELKEVAKGGIYDVKAYFDGLDIGYELPPLLTAEEVRLLDRYEQDERDEMSVAEIEQARDIIGRLADYAKDAPKDYVYSSRDTANALASKKPFWISRKKEYCPVVVPF